jgi:hypothetical protein
MAVDALDHARVEPRAGGEGEPALVHARDVDRPRRPGVGQREQVLGGVDHVVGDAEHAHVDVGRAAGQHAQRRVGPRQAVDHLVDRPVAAERHDDVVALARGLAAELGRMALALGVDRLDLVAALERVDHEALQAVRHRRRVRVDDDQHPLGGASRPSAAASAIRSNSVVSSPGVIRASGAGGSSRASRPAA